MNLYSNKAFNEKLNNKSAFLNVLSNKNCKSIKSLRQQKIDNLFEEISGNNKFKRNYYLLYKASITKNNKINKNNKISLKKERNKNIPLLKPYYKIILTSPSEKEYPETYKKKDFMIDDFSSIYLKSKPINIFNVKQYKIENNSYKQRFKKQKVINSSEFCLPILRRN